MSFWDEQFAGDQFKYGTAPNSFLAGEAARLGARAQILVPGDGEGRNSVWLAGQGHQVTALDQSAVGLAKARALAAVRGVTIAPLQADLSTWSPEPDAWDAIVLTYVHLPPAWRRDAHRRLAGGLRRGGVLLLEGFHPAQLGRSSGGPKDVAMLFTLAMLREDFGPEGPAPLTELVGWDGEVILDEGPGHQGAAMVTRFVGRR
ncbi:MAG: class I SAM-dependent methyltransferase [Gemmatimonadetes bacterium]|nr:class I SAM-dependent methyltransferase [Gemmatimonadota bacterium]